jgi:hypothetical protein
MSFVIAGPEELSGGRFGFGPYRFDDQRGQRRGGGPHDERAGRGR